MWQHSPKSEGTASEDQAVELLRVLGKELGQAQTAEAEVAVETAVRTLAEQALLHEPLAAGDAAHSIELLISELDQRLTEQLNVILHHPDFQTLEATWRGLWFLCSQPHAHETVVIKALNVTRRELAADARATFFESVLVQRLYIDGRGTPTGTPFGALLADFALDGTDRALLRRLVEVGRLALTPIVAAASPALFGLLSYREIAQPARLAVSPDVDYWWRQFRKLDAARFISLVLPRVLMRRPYGAAEAGEFNFEEDVQTHAQFLWANAVWLLGDAIVRAFSRDGWFALVSSGHLSEDTALPRHDLLDDDGNAVRIGPIESPISYAREKEIAELGFIPLVPTVDGADAVAHLATTVYEEQSLDRTGLVRTRRTFAADLRGVLCASRFAQALAGLARGTREHGLQAWLDGYVAPPDRSPDASRPLRSAAVRIDPRKDGRFDAAVTLSIWPAFQFDRSEPLDLQVFIETVYPQPSEWAVPSATPTAPASSDRAGISDQPLPPFQLLQLVPTSEPHAILEAFWRALDDVTVRRCRVVFGPLTIDVVVDATRPIEELVDWVCGDEHRLELDVADVPDDATLDLSRLGFLVRYPSNVVKGLSAALEATEGRYRLLVLDPLALLDPAGGVPIPTSEPVECRLNVLVLDPIHEPA